jgi:hypothetical protein
VLVAHFLNCNNVKSNNWTADDIMEACVSSAMLEVKGDSIRRVGNKLMPAAEFKKRDIKAIEKKIVEVLNDEYDESGKPILTEKDFDNPLIVSYEAKVKEDEEFKVDWKEVERGIKEAYPKLKLIYSRMDPHGGHVAFSQLRL